MHYNSPFWLHFYFFRGRNGPDGLVGRGFAPGRSCRGRAPERKGIRARYQSARLEDPPKMIDALLLGTAFAVDEEERPALRVPAPSERSPLSPRCRRFREIEMNGFREKTAGIGGK